MSSANTIILIILSMFLCMGGIGGCMYVRPQYRVYTQTMRGEADLKEAEINKKIIVQEAIAQEEASVMRAKTRVTLAQAENEAMKIKAEGEAERDIIRAKATASANEIIGGSLKGNSEYLRYLWITEISNSEKGERIYIPTEAGLPLLEAK